MIILRMALFYSLKYNGMKRAKRHLSIFDIRKNIKAKTCIRRLNSESNGQIEDPHNIMLEIKTFYSNLYKRTSVKTEEECLQYLSKLSTPKLSEDEKRLCEGKLTLNECWNALSSMKNGKA